MRPGMYGDPCCLEVQAMTSLITRRILLGSDEPAVHGSLLVKRFGTSQTPAFCHLRCENQNLFRQRMADFIAEWWRLEQIAVPDPERDEHVNECRLFAVREQIAMLPEAERHEAWSRIGVSFTHPGYAVERYGCKVVGNEVLWPDGSKYPIEIPSDRETVRSIMER